MFQMVDVDAFKLPNIITFSTMHVVLHPSRRTDCFRRPTAIPARTPSVPADRIVQSILVLRGHRVMLDSELANLYGVATKVLLQAVKRNGERFPEDFMLRLSVQEWEFFKVTICDLKNRQWMPPQIPALRVH